MQQKTLIALGALVVIAVLAWVTLRAPEKGQRVGPPPRPIAAFKATDVKELEVSSNNGKDHTVMKWADAHWSLTAPSPFNADQQAAKTAVEQLEKIGFGDIVTENAAKFADLEVSDDKGAHVIARGDGGKVLFDAWLGKSGSGFTMLRPTGKNEVWQASGLFKYTYAKESKVWRDHMVVEVPKEDVTKLAVEGGGQKLALERIPPAEKNGESKWKVLESSVKLDPLDDSAANGMIQTLSSLRAAEFDDTSKPADVGLAPPQLKITVTVKAQPVTILVGNRKGDDSWVQVEGRPQIYLLQKYLIEKLAVMPKNFRDKTITKVKDTDLTEVDVTVGTETLVLKHEGAAWKPAKGEVDDAKVKQLIGGFDNLQGNSFAESVDPKVTGLGKPTGTAVLHLRDKSVVTVKVGAVKDGLDYYVQRVGSPDVLMAKKFLVDRFLKKQSDLAKAATPPPGGMGMPHGMQMPAGHP
jgi:hypothetical protein